METNRESLEAAATRDDLKIVRVAHVNLAAAASHLLAVLEHLKLGDERESSILGDAMLSLRMSLNVAVTRESAWQRLEYGAQAPGD